MTKFLHCILLLALVLSSSIYWCGCQTYGEAAGLGAAVGSVAGAVIGHQSGHALEGAAVGAVLGGLAGLVAHDIKVRQAKSAQQTAAEYNYQASQGEKLLFERAEVLPPTTTPGNMIESTIQYALLGTGSGVQVTESRTLVKGNQVIAELSTSTMTRTDGTWVSSQQFRLPPNLTPGEYSILTRVTTRLSSISGSASFIVN
ncbi:MAG: glycine zipper family protein [Candidatus Hydrogenedentes bacterium]|nr:glycine zipper family protein [Candidatus Hydrogenedentota bacterium]